jgi:hypothetical protein
LFHVRRSNWLDFAVKGTTENVFGIFDI